MPRLASSTIKSKLDRAESRAGFEPASLGSMIRSQRITFSSHRDSNHKTACYIRSQSIAPDCASPLSFILNRVKAGMRGKRSEHANIQTETSRESDTDLLMLCSLRGQSVC
ncbi:hypothetical protein BDE02_05G186200 [Populus trichocarpa]|nr:hypothetical protein BDE02_05G186200 [Populus trichocarpa]